MNPIPFFGNGGIPDTDWMIIFILIFAFLFLFITGVMLKSGLWQLLAGFFAILLATQVFRITQSVIGAAAISTLGLFIIIFSLIDALTDWS